MSCTWDNPIFYRLCPKSNEIGSYTLSIFPPPNHGGLQPMFIYNFDNEKEKIYYKKESNLKVTWSVRHCPSQTAKELPILWPALTGICFV